MSYVIATPEYVAAAATDLANIGTAINDANAMAVGPTMGVLAPAGADEVSTGIAALFGAHAQAFQAISAQAAAFHDQFVQMMSLGAQQYGLSEAANVSSIQTDAAAPQPTLGRSVLSHGAQVAPAAGATAQPAALVGPLGPGGPATTPAAQPGPVYSSGSAVAAGSVGSVKRQPIPSLQTSPREIVEVQTPAAAVSALPAPLAARAAPAAEVPAPVARVVATGEARASA
ncbi:PE family protein [Mycobacterium vicinigordonae]|uniref:PE family protein n=1 Tax=Mycobacterium vicinigordonae TaxID=1719132 RepID=A0A7D6HZ28_9MYCO|nr:PE family protein [Mycobacterium vicinigordonae]QLL08335.1 PE family protein [Mycobacterium vicinigordonae]